jgi:hypothetical protein
VVLQLEGWFGDKQPPTVKKKQFVTKQLMRPQIRTNLLAQLMHWKMEMRVGTEKIRSLYRTGSLKMAASELGKCKLDLVGVQVRWEKGGTERAEDYKFLYGERWSSSARDRFICT